MNTGRRQQTLGRRHCRTIPSGNPEWHLGVYFELPKDPEIGGLFISIWSS